MGRRLRELTDAGADYERRHDVEGVLTEVDMQPLYSEEGELMGVRLSDVEPGGVFSNAGLRPGDVVTSINGLPFGSPSAVAELASDFALHGEFALAVERPDGSQEIVTISADSLNETIAAQD
jgi:type II secretory pathway component PulC